MFIRNEFEEFFGEYRKLSLVCVYAQFRGLGSERTSFTTRFPLQVLELYRKREDAESL